MILNLNNNNITVIPNLPPTLRDLHLNNNHITAIPDLPNTLTYLTILNNKITSIGKLSESDDFVLRMDPPKISNFSKENLRQLQVHFINNPEQHEDNAVLIREIDRLLSLSVNRSRGGKSKRTKNKKTTRRNKKTKRTKNKKTTRKNK
jgi:hypothetical protein